MDLIILDAAPVKFGSRVLCGPRVGFFAATHSTDVDERQGGYERAYPIEIGDDCWIGGGAIINGPSKIGKGCTVAAGAVVCLPLLIEDMSSADTPNRLEETSQIIA
jgi:acetyltransferase-like isoleucine patch superfamily enzyme